jgi:hypothetical protein
MWDSQVSSAYQMGASKRKWGCQFRLRELKPQEYSGFVFWKTEHPLFHTKWYYSQNVINLDEFVWNIYIIICVHLLCRINSCNLLFKNDYSAFTTERELLSTIETCKEYANTLIIYRIKVFTDHINDAFNRLKVAYHVFPWVKLLEENGWTIVYVPWKKHVVADAWLCFKIDDLMISQMEALKHLWELEYSSNIRFPRALTLWNQIKVSGLGDKGLSQSYYSIQKIGWYDILNVIMIKSMFICHYRKD